MRRVKLPRHGNVDLEFNGELLSEVSTESDGNERWEEIRIWRMFPDKPSSPLKWVVERVGKSDVADEVDLVNAEMCKTPVDVRFALRRRASGSGRWYFTDAALEALEDAAEVDERLHEALVERV